MRRSVLWQIYVPLGVAIVALLALMGLTIFMTIVAGSPAHAPWADVSAMYLIVFAAIGALVVLVVVAGLCVGLWFALRELPGYFKIAQDFMLLVAQRAAELSQKVAAVFITPRASASAAQKALDSARSVITPRRKP